MLILTRRTQEALKIGDEINLTVLAVNGEQVKVGIAAPDEVKVYRKEIFRGSTSDSDTTPAPVRP